MLDVAIDCQCGAQGTSRYVKLNSLLILVSIAFLFPIKIGFTYNVGGNRYDQLSKLWSR